MRRQRVAAPCGDSVWRHCAATASGGTVRRTRAPRGMRGAALPALTPACARRVCYVHTARALYVRVRTTRTRTQYKSLKCLNEPCLCEAVAWAMLRARVLGPALLFGPAHCQFIRRRVVGRATSGEYFAGAVVGGSKRRVTLLRPPCPAASQRTASSSCGRWPSDHRPRHRHHQHRQQASEHSGLRPGRRHLRRHPPGHRPGRLRGAGDAGGHEPWWRGL